MQALFKHVKICDKTSPHHFQTVDLLVENGTISQISPNIIPPENAKIYASDREWFVSYGWCDAFVDFAEPGFEHRETLETGLTAATHGGFTAVGLLPNTQPVGDHLAQIDFIRQKTADNLVEVFPIAALTKDFKGKDLVDFFELWQKGGIKLFSDALQSIEDEGLLLRCLQYVKMFGAGVATQVLSKSLALDGHINEGIMSAKLGLSGISHIAEEVQLARNIYLAAYSGTAYHAALVSTANSVALIREAKQKGINISASVSVYHLLWTDEKVQNFDTNYKLLPPLRTPEDTKALWEAVLDGTIDVVCSAHSPQHEDDKKTSFAEAAWGIGGIETAFSLLNTEKNLHPIIADIAHIFSHNSRKIFQENTTPISEGVKANLCFFDLTSTWKVEKQQLFSKAYNNPLLGETLTGKIWGVVNKGQLQWFD
ncbi:MAG: dihydroorotase [Chitinophagales bacterium]|nr:dihydroorotase [Bacteroidota bacterium]MCB9043712.1 dihydroorotase [Chitinophagales bacterium]